MYVCENYASTKKPKFLEISPDWQKHAQFQKQKLETDE